MALVLFLPALLQLTGCDGPVAPESPAFAKVTMPDGRVVDVAVVLPAVEPPERPLFTWVLPSVSRVRARPDTASAVLGLLGADAPFHVYLREETTSGCTKEGWGLVEGGGWTCLDGGTQTDREPSSLSRVNTFDPPSPDETNRYLETGTWPRDPVAPGEGLLPFVYGKRWLRWAGPEYGSLDDFLANTPLRELGGFRKYHFTDVIETERGTVLARDNGHVVPLDGVWIYPTSRFQGVDLSLDPPPAGAVPGWSIATRGLDVRALPEDDAEVSWTAPFHHPLWVETDVREGWFRVIDRTHEHPGGWVRPSASLRWWRPSPPPAEALETEWIDVDLPQQVLAWRRGELTFYVTLVSTGARGDETPEGLFRVMDKAAWWDMASLPESTRPYHVEAVPWVMHFYPRYALHGAFWHDRFGTVQSHGCINLSPRDARWIFDHVSPTLPPGWWTVDERRDDPGTLLRVRSGDTPVRDRRRGL